MEGEVKVFAGFDLSNPAHRAFVKRKLVHRARYERQFARRRALPVMIKCGSGCPNLPYHRKAIVHAALRAPMGRDSETLVWQHAARNALELAYHSPNRQPLHPMYRRHPITGRIV